MRAQLDQLLEGRRYRVAVILGSGLSHIAASLTGAEPISYSRIDGFPVSAVEGHEGALYPGDVEGTPVLVFAGRAHLYEGHDSYAVTSQVRSAVGAGCEIVILTNAAGAIAETLEVGALCLISDHLNLTGRNPLEGIKGRGWGEPVRRLGAGVPPREEEGRPPFLDLTEGYDARLRALARDVDPALREGIYAGMLGPTYETPAEVRMLRTLGADLVGMSTVHEAIVARHLGARVLGISVVSNFAAGIAESPLDHAEVTAAGRAAAGRLEELLSGVSARL